MVSLSKTIVTKIRDKQGDITEDEVSLMTSLMKKRGGSLKRIPSQIY